MKRGLGLVMSALLLMIIFNLSSLNVPSDKVRFNRSRQYFSETSQKFGLASYGANDVGMGMTGDRNKMTLLTDVRPAFNLLVSELEHARKNINMELFIIRDDQTGRHFKNVLIRKAQQGVEVRLLYDAWGSAFTSKSYFNDLRRNGVKVAAYNPLLSGFLQGRLGNRLHRKIIVIDGKQAFIGGENIGDEYLGKNNKIGFWKDTGIIYQGDAALAIQQLFLNDWLQASREKITGKSFYPSTSGLMPNMVRVISGGPDSPLTNMSLTYARLVNKAQDQVLITSPYYFPDKAMAQALYKAVQRKVTVHLILPRKSDHKLTRLAQPYYINQLISHGIKVSTYNRGFIHSKIMIIDNLAASIGSANLDRFSFYRNYEVNSIIYNKDVITQLQQDFTRTLKDSTTLASKQ